MTSLNQKLNPAHFMAMSPMMAAIVGYIIGETYTKPAMASLVITSDGFVIAMHVGEIGDNNLLGSESDLRRNWHNLLDAADLTEDERDEAFRLFNLKVPA
jgi:hypothetical protein